MTLIPQPGLFIEETAYHYHLEFSLGDRIEAGEVVAAVAAARQAATAMRGPNTVWGFSPRLWQLLAPQQTPEALHPFEGVTGIEGLVAPATQSDIWFWCHGNVNEKVWRTAYDVAAELRAVASLDIDLPAYVAVDNRDSIGFIDGTENPALDEALEVSLIPDGLPGAGGSPVLVQKWIHDLEGFEDLPLPEQEQVFGRTRADSIELPEDRMPPTSHVSRNVIEDESGNELHIFRRNTTFATVTEIGTQFIGCCADPAVLDTMLDRMFGATGDGLTDHLTKYSTPVSGSYYFVPAVPDMTGVFGPLEPDAG